MKAKALWVLKYLIVPFGFVWATGIISGIQNLEKTKTQDPYSTFTQQELSTLVFTPSNFNHVFDSIISVRKKEFELKKYYSAHTYFSDLKQMYMYTAVYRDSITAYALDPWITMRRNKLTHLRDTYGHVFNKIAQEHHDAAEANERSIEAAREYWFPLEKAERIEREQNPFSWTRDFLIPCSTWFTRFYLNGFIFALILFGFWRKRISQEFDQPSLISFFLCLIIWPLILAIDIRNKMSELLDRAEVISRRKKMFTLFSEQEKQLLALRKTMSFSEFKAHLDDLGMRQNHYLGTALVATFFLLIIPQSVVLAIETSVIKKDIVSIRECDHGNESIIDASGYSCIKILSTYPEIPAIPSEAILIVFSRFQAFAWFYFCDFIPDIGSVPKVF